MDIGDRIKHLRKQKGLTLEELAARSELTKGFLSQLERNLTSPSIATLDDILEALGTSLSEFFKEDSDERIVFGASDFYIAEKDDHTIKWIVPNAQKRAMEPILLELPPEGRSFDMAPNNGEEPYQGENQEGLVLYAKEYLKTHPDINYFIFGHRHIGLDLMLSRDTRLIILGEWITLFTYAVWDGEYFFMDNFIEGETEL